MLYVYIYIYIYTSIIGRLCIANDIFGLPSSWRVRPSMSLSLSLSISLSLYTYVYVYIYIYIYYVIKHYGHTLCIVLTSWRYVMTHHKS